MNKFAMVVGGFVAIAMSVLAGHSVLHAQSPNENDFRQDPTIDFRSVILDITTDTDAQFEIVIANPSLNDQTQLTGELLFRVPPGVTIYSSLLGGSGGTGLVQVPFTNDPIKPGAARVFTFFARSTKVGSVAVFAGVSYWPVDYMDLAKSTNRQFPITVKQPSTLVGLPEGLNKQSDAVVADVQEDSGSFSMTGTDNPFGWANWFLILVTVVILFALWLGYKIIIGGKSSSSGGS